MHVAVKGNFNTVLKYCYTTYDLYWCNHSVMSCCMHSYDTTPGQPPIVLSEDVDLSLYTITTNFQCLRLEKSHPLHNEALYNIAIMVA